MKTPTPHPSNASALVRALFLSLLVLSPILSPVTADARDTPSPGPCKPQDPSVAIAAVLGTQNSGAVTDGIAAAQAADPAPPADALGKKEQTILDRIRNSRDLLKGLTQPDAAKDAAKFAQLLPKAQCAVFIPNRKSVGFIIGGSYGAGIVICRKEDGSPTALFVKMEGGSFGYQIGGEETDLMAVMFYSDAQKQLLSGKGIKLGAQVSAALGPEGRELSGQTNVAMREGTVSYSPARGIYAGAALTSARLTVDKDANKVAADSKTLHDELTRLMWDLQEAQQARHPADVR